MWKGARPKAKYKVIYQNREKYPVSQMCTFFAVSRSGYYAYANRLGRPERDEELARLIAVCQTSCKMTYGYRRVWLWLQRRGVHHNPKTIRRVMRKYGLLSQMRRRKKYRQMGEHIHKYENLLNRNFTADTPSSKWVTDISYIHTPQGVLYLSIIRDLFDNSIVAYKTATKQTVSLVLDTIHLAFKKQKAATELLLHSDQGFQYTSSAYLKLTQEYAITPSMSRRGNCYDNAMAENFFSILKTECIYPNMPNSFQHANELIDDFIFFYNNHRIQLKTGKAPFESRRLAS